MPPPTPVRTETAAPLRAIRIALSELKNEDDIIRQILCYRAEVIFR